MASLSHSRILLALLLPALIMSCGRANTNLVREPKEGESLVCSTSGTFQIRSKKTRSWEALACGSTVKEEQGIRTGSDGEAYLRTGQNILMRLGPDTEVSFRYSGKEESLTVILSKGSLAVENPGAELIVRQSHLSLYSAEGTFILSSGEEQVSVYNHDGELRLLPGIGDLADLMNILKPEERSWGEELLENQRPLFPGETWYLDGETLRNQGKRFDQLLLEYSGLEPEKIDMEEPVNRILAMDITISEYSRRNYDPFLTGFDLFRKGDSLSRYRMTIQSEEDARIRTSFNEGKGQVDLVLTEDQTVPVEIAKAGYQKVSTELSPLPVQSFSDRRLIKLSRLTSRKIAIQVNPPESEITINGIYAGKGNIVLEVKPDEPLEVNLTLDGYNEQYLYLDAEKEWPETIQLELKKTVEKVVRGAYQEVIGINARGDDIYVADWSGIVWYLHEPSGWRRFNTRTSNYPNNYSAPVLTDNYIYFSGKRNLVVINRLTGGILNTIRLNERETHLNGQHAVPLDYQVLYPTKDSLRFLTGDGKKIREVFIPGGSLMTPSLYGGYIYTAATDGQIYEISPAGKILRSLATGLESPMGQSIVFDEGRGYFCDSRGQVAAFSPSSMTLEWVSEPLRERRNFIRDVQLTEEKVFFYGGETLYALDRDTGKSRPPVSQSIQTYPLLKEPYLYAMTDDERMTVFSADSGEPVKEIDLEWK